MKRIITVLILCLFLAGCNSEPIYEATNLEITSNISEPEQRQPDIQPVESNYTYRCYWKGLNKICN